MYDNTVCTLSCIARQIYPTPDSRAAWGYLVVFLYLFQFDFGIGCRFLSLTDMNTVATSFEDNTWIVNVDCAVDFHGCVNG